MFGLNRALRETLPALETTVAVTVGICAFIALLGVSAIGAWSLGFYFWLRESMAAPEAAFLAGLVLLVLCVIAVFAGRAAIRASFKQETPPPSPEHDAIANAIEAIGDMAKARPLPALLSALALGLAAGYFDDGEKPQRPR